jgi:hypothetical protein
MLVVGGDLLDLNDVSVARTLISHPSGVSFRRITLMDGDSAAPVRRPGAVIITNDGLGLSIAESYLVGRHRGTSPPAAVIPVKHGWGGRLPGHNFDQL